jgi:hypothetical protein
MPSTVPLNAIPNQQLQVQLGMQGCTIAIQQSSYGLFLSLWVGTTLIIASVLCENLVRIVRDSYLGFDGDLAFCDSQGEQNPTYDGLGGPTARYQLLYLSESDLEQYAT